MERDGANKSLWQGIENYRPVAGLNIEKLYDIVIVGGGITGITSALLLQSAGKKCLLLEAQTLGFGTTGGTTAHLNTFFDTPYYKVSKNFGIENAQLLAHAAEEAMATIKKNISDYNIDCEYDTKDGYLFSINESQDKELDDIVESAQSFGVQVNFTNHSPFPIPYLKLAVFNNQAQFNPIQYIFSMARAFEELGGVILQHHRVSDIVQEDDDQLSISANNKVFTATKVIYATHIPPGVNLLHFRCAPYRSYAIAFKLRGEYPDALGYDMNDPYHYYRTQKVEDQLYLIAGGEDHKTGHEENTDNCFRRLESHVRSYFDVESIDFKWSSQYYEPADGLPYIGKLPGSEGNIYVATGFGGNGMIYGTLAATILSDIINNGKSIYQDLFDPNRIKPIAGFANFVKEGADAVASFVKGKFNTEKIKTLTEIAAGEAKILKQDGHILAIYKDDARQLHVLNAACTHTKCTVGWNNSEKTWDCPCHGARYSPEGEVLNGPAQVNLENVDWEEKTSKSSPS
ncbi:MAG: FAD-dependent oxidoreductase [Ferruginibacter sp.]|uniref:FAD-dependent oxidoreductase n=1 Tax=Ferruginibacter sp. TaxID=1940288 RepID=UPI0026581E0D|nr:FAD-dependent oxidoreductase [Ferruginibacter sp.]MDB5279592.1 FAD-dependent oxidoreductase [Ferruginibacter sp.]